MSLAGLFWCFRSLGRKYLDHHAKKEFAATKPEIKRGLFVLRPIQSLVMAYCSDPTVLQLTSLCTERRRSAVGRSVGSTGTLRLPAVL